MDSMRWIEFGVRTTLALGQTVFELVNAMNSGDLDTVEALSKVLDDPDKIIARSEAVKAQVRRSKANG